MELVQLLHLVDNPDYEIDQVLVNNPALILDGIQAVYSKIERHKYSDIFSFVRDYNGSSEGLAFFVLKIEEISKYLDKVDHIYKVQFSKLYDHLCLEAQRKEYFDGRVDTLIDSLDSNLRVEINEYTEEMDKLKGSIKEEHEKIDILQAESLLINKELKEDTKNITQKVNDLYVQFITILGIFTAIVFALFGGITSISSTVNIIATNSIDLAKALVIILLIVLIMTNLMYLFIYLIGKLIDKPIGYRCNNSHDCSCGKKQSISCRLKNRHGLIYWSNIIIVSICLILGFVHYVDVYESINSEHLVFKLE